MGVRGQVGPCSDEVCPALHTTPPSPALEHPSPSVSVSRGTLEAVPQSCLSQLLSGQVTKVPSGGRARVALGFKRLTTRGACLDPISLLEFLPHHHGTQELVVIYVFFCIFSIYRSPFLLLLNLFPWHILGNVHQMGLKVAKLKGLS